MEYQIWLNGEYVARSEAKISMMDRGFRLGDVVFDTSRTFNGSIYRLEDHIDRLYRSLKYLRIDPGMTKAEMASVTQQVVEKNEPARRRGDDYMVTQIVTRGSFRSGSDEMSATVSVWIDPIDFKTYSPLYREGAHVVIPRTRAYSSQQVDPKIKHYNRLNFVLAELEVKDIDPEAFPLLLDMDGNVSESSGANFCIVSDGVLITPGDDATLQGVSQATLLELAEQLEIPTSVEHIQPYDVYNADEALLCTTPYCLLPVGRADKRQIGDEVPGPVTQRLLAAWSERVGLDIVDQADSMAAVSNQ